MARSISLLDRRAHNMTLKIQTLAAVFLSSCLLACGGSDAGSAGDGQQSAQGSSSDELESIVVGTDQGSILQALTTIGDALKEHDIPKAKAYAKAVGSSYRPMEALLDTLEKYEDTLEAANVRWGKESAALESKALEDFETRFAKMKSDIDGWEKQLEVYNGLVEDETRALEDASAEIERVKAGGEAALENALAFVNKVIEEDNLPIDPLADDTAITRGWMFCDFKVLTPELREWADLLIARNPELATRGSVTFDGTDYFISDGKKVGPAEVIVKDANYLTLAEMYLEWSIARIRTSSGSAGADLRQDHYKAGQALSAAKPAALSASGIRQMSSFMRLLENYGKSYATRERPDSENARVLRREDFIKKAIEEIHDTALTNLADFVMSR